jgi:hypothetical protein
LTQLARQGSTIGDLDKQTTLKQRFTYDVHAESSSKRLKTCSPSDATIFPLLVSQTKKDDMIKEFLQQTGNEVLARQECSFCGLYELRSQCVLKAVDRLQISLLQAAVHELQTSSHQMNIQPFEAATVNNGMYTVCHLCALSIKQDKFISLPVHSYANGLWVGEVPSALQGLTFLEEQCIARI